MKEGYVIGWTRRNGEEEIGKLLRSRDETNQRIAELNKECPDIPHRSIWINEDTLPSSKDCINYDATVSAEEGKVRNRLPDAIEVLQRHSATIDLKEGYAIAWVGHSGEEIVGKFLRSRDEANQLAAELNEAYSDIPHWSIWLSEDTQPSSKDCINYQNRASAPPIA